MSSTQQDPQVQVQRDRAKKPSTVPWGKLIGGGVIVFLLLSFIFSNSARWEFNFLFLGPYELRAWMMLLLTLVIGFVIGMVVSALLRRRKRRELKHR